MLSNEGDAMRGALHNIKTYIMCVRFLNGGGGGDVGQLLWRARGSDLPLNKDALLGSGSWPGGVKADMCGKPE